ncbi:hypothetical protein FQA39_LY11305 [Lamprigera yunnana]|nr:hypothetical protein FQA39_LY11305 [Lamprigera yunnana]
MVKEDKRATEECSRINKETRKSIRKYRRETREKLVNEVMRNNKEMKCLKQKMGKKQTYNGDNSQIENKIKIAGSEEQPSINIEEVKKIIKDMKSNKAPGEDDISIDMIREEKT